MLHLEHPERSGEAWCGAEVVRVRGRNGIYRPGHRGWVKTKNPANWRRDSEIELMQRRRERAEPQTSLRDLQSAQARDDPTRHLGDAPRRAVTKMRGKDATDIDLLVSPLRDRAKWEETVPPLWRGRERGAGREYGRVW